jgi:hypothetical protein
MSGFKNTAVNILRDMEKIVDDFCFPKPGLELENCEKPKAESGQPELNSLSARCSLTVPQIGEAFGGKIPGRRFPTCWEVPRNSRYQQSLGAIRR